MGIKLTSKTTREGQQYKNTVLGIADLEVRVGFQRGESQEENGVDMVDIAMWNELGTEHSPSRPFMRMSVDDNMDDIKAFMQEQHSAMLNGASAKEVMNNLGLYQKDLIQGTILDGEFAPNAPSTIKKKGSSKPLIDTGRMLQSVNYVVKKKGSGEE